MKTTTVPVRLNAETRARLREVASRLETSVSSVIRLAIKLHLKGGRP